MVKVLLSLVFTLITPPSLAAELDQPAPDLNKNPAANIKQKVTCGFTELPDPSEFEVHSVVVFSGRKLNFQIDQSGHEAVQVDVVVNNTKKPVVLMLGAYYATIWNIHWSPKTKILAVFAGGMHRQAVAGLENDTPVFINIPGLLDTPGLPCGAFWPTVSDLSQLNPMARHVFGRPVDMTYFAKNGKVTVGKPIPAGGKLVTSSETSPESFHDKLAPLAGPEGIKEAVRNGLLRKLTAADAESWADAVAQNSPDRDIPPVTGQGIPKPPKPSLYEAYMVLKPFTFPSGLYGGNAATFVIPKGVPMPDGDPGHSAVYDFNTLECKGALCSK